MAQHALTLGAERGDDQRSARSNVGHSKLGALQPARTVHEGVQPPLDADAGSHPRELIHMLETILVNVFGDHRLALGLCHERHVLRLEIRRKSGIWPRGHVGGFDRRVAPATDAKPALAGLDVRACLLELQEHDVQVLGPAALQSQLTAGGSHSDGVGARLEIVRDHRVLGSTQLPHAIDDQPLGADALDPGSHLAEQRAQVLHVRFPRCVEDLGAALRQHGREEDVLGAGYRRKIEHYPRPAQPRGLRHQLCLRLLDPGAHLAQSAQVLLDPSGSDVIAAGPWQTRLAEAADQRAEEQDGGPHAAPELIRNLAGASAGGVDPYLPLPTRRPAEPGDDLAHQSRVGDSRHVREDHLV